MVRKVTQMEKQPCAVRLTAVDHNAAVWFLRCVDDRLDEEAWPADGAELTRLAAVLQERNLPAGTVALARGRPPDGVWAVRSGALELVAGSGRHRVVTSLLQPGDLAGDVPLLQNQPAEYTVRALTEVRAQFLPAAHFRTLLWDSPALTRAWLTGLARRYGRVQQDLAQSVGGPAEGRVARLLLRQARGGRVTVTQDTLAAMLGLRRPTLNRVIKEFERQGLLRVGYRSIELLAVDRLRHRAWGTDHETPWVCSSR